MQIEFNLRENEKSFSCPLKILHKHCFNFSWGGCEKKKVMQNWGGQIRCIMEDVQVAYRL